MKAIVNTAPGRLDWCDWPLPEPGPGQVRIRTRACGICATDLAMIAGWDRTSPPSIPGHEWSGVVDAVGGGVDESLVGQPCVAENVLEDGGEVGFEHPGAYGQFLVTSAANVHPLPEGYAPETAVLLEPLAVCVRGRNRLRLSDPSRALIMGDGPIGLLMLMVLRDAGVGEICMVGGREPRLRLAGELGAIQTFDHRSAGDGLADAISAAFGGCFPNVIEASGSEEAMAAALNLSTVGGKVLALGDYAGARANFRWNHLLHRELELIGSNASAGAWPEAVRLATEENLPLHRLITHQFPAEQFSSAFDVVRNSPEAVKVVLSWPDAEHAEQG